MKRVAARHEADAVGWPHLVAEAAYLEARAANNLDEPPATPFFLDAIRLATESRDDTLLARAYVGLVRYDSNIATYAQQALLLADLATGTVARAGNEPRLVAQLRSARAESFLSLEKTSDAEAAFRSAHDELARAYGPLDPGALVAESNVARVLRRTGKYRAARELQEQLLERTIQRLGPLHPDVATMLHNLAIIAKDLGDRDGAARYLERSLAIEQQVLGPEASATALTLATFAGVNLERGRLADAVTQFRRALAIEERVFGASSEEVATARIGFGVALRKQGKLEESRAELERAREAFTKVFGRDTASAAAALDHLGELREASNDPAGALADFDQALALRTKSLGADHPMTLASIAQRARVLAASGRCREVQADLSRAIAGFTRLAAGDDSSAPDFADALAVEARCAASAGRSDRGVRASAANQGARPCARRRAGPVALAARAAALAARRARRCARRCAPGAAAARGRSRWRPRPCRPDPVARRAWRGGPSRLMGLMTELPRLRAAGVVAMLPSAINSR